MPIFDKAKAVIETTKLNSKISAEQNAITAVMAKIGEFYYAKYKETGTADEGITGFCKVIDGHNTVISETKAEIDRIKAEQAAATAPAAAGGLVCSSCGKADAAGRKFCAECGGKLEAAKPAPVQDGLTCSSCGKTSPADRKFCAECGGKLEAKPEAEKRVCACGTEVAPGLKFCGECGAKYE
ncbi:MAG: zinc ribbon domain-containing protein [Defluviitaleaceae bacterium]|nr:zinc ribbon domain-containing protein [Defluviitaleaceae bacterium]